MSEGGLAALGVKPVLLLGQIVNFTILFLILKKLVYGPLIKALKNKQEKEAKRKALQEKIEKEWANLETEIKNKKAGARREAQKVIKQAKVEAEKEKEIILEKAKKEAAETLERAKREAMQQKQKSRKETEKQAIKLATALTEKLIDEFLGEKEQKTLIFQATKSLKKIRV